MGKEIPNLWALHSYVEHVYDRLTDVEAITKCFPKKYKRALSYPIHNLSTDLEQVSGELQELIETLEEKTEKPYAD